MKWTTRRVVSKLDRMLFTATRYPHDYGFVEETLGLDGDPWMPWCWCASTHSPAA